MVGVRSTTHTEHTTGIHTCFTTLTTSCNRGIHTTPFPFSPLQGEPPIPPVHTQIICTNSIPWLNSTLGGHRLRCIPAPQNTCATRPHHSLPSPPQLTHRFRSVHASRLISPRFRSDHTSLLTPRVMRQVRPHLRTSFHAPFPLLALHSTTRAFSDRQILDPRRAARRNPSSLPSVGTAATAARPTTAARHDRISPTTRPWGAAANREGSEIRGPPRPCRPTRRGRR